ncbi:hypothetical protein HK102_002609 [Quaeritorhiza haematococci]|nr:hypothetical protein HK102_002609 [Quaeritorhiza haematococci]
MSSRTRTSTRKSQIRSRPVRKPPPCKQLRTPISKGAGGNVPPTPFTPSSERIDERAGAPSSGGSAARVQKHGGGFRKIVAEEEWMECFEAINQISTDLMTQAFLNAVDIDDQEENWKTLMRKSFSTKRIQFEFAELVEGRLEQIENIMQSGDVTQLQDKFPKWAITTKVAKLSAKIAELLGVRNEGGATDRTASTASSTPPSRSRAPPSLSLPTPRTPSNQKLAVVVGRRTPDTTSISTSMKRALPRRAAAVAAASAIASISSKTSAVGVQQEKVSISEVVEELIEKRAVSEEDEQEEEEEEEEEQEEEEEEEEEGDEEFRTPSGEESESLFQTQEEGSPEFGSPSSNESDEGRYQGRRDKGKAPVRHVEKPGQSSFSEISARLELIQRKRMGDKEHNDGRPEKRQRPLEGSPDLFMDEFYEEEYAEPEAESAHRHLIQEREESDEPTSPLMRSQMRNGHLLRSPSIIGRGPAAEEQPEQDGNDALSNSRPQQPQRRNKWSRDETEALVDGIKRFGYKWSDIEKFHGASGTGRLAGRGQVSLKDKARSMKETLMRQGKTGMELGIWRFASERSGARAIAPRVVEETPNQRTETGTPAIDGGED